MQGELATGSERVAIGPARRRFAETFSGAARRAQGVPAGRSAVRSILRTCLAWGGGLLLGGHGDDYTIGELHMTTNPTTTYPFVEIARRLSPAFAQRAAEYDTNGRFVSENYVLLKEHRAFSA